MTKAARSAECHPNAVMFGAMAASNCLPMTPESCREAISQSAVAVKNNLAGFEAGMNLGQGSPDEGDTSKISFDRAPAKFSNIVASLPKSVQSIAAHSAAHLLDYQNVAYVELYFDRLSGIVALDNEKKDFRLSKIGRAHV